MRAMSEERLTRILFACVCGVPLFGEVGDYFIENASFFAYAAEGLDNVGDEDSSIKSGHSLML